MSKDDRALITRAFGEFSELNDGQFASKIFETHEFGYRRITVERPLRLSAQLTEEAIAGLRFAPKPFNNVMRWAYEQYGDGCYTSLAEHETTIREKMKKDFAELKEKQIKELLDTKLWNFQKTLMDKAITLHQHIGNEQHNDFNEFEVLLKKAMNASSIKLDTKEKKQLLDTITWTNPEAEPVIKKVLKEEEQPLYGAFAYKGKVVEFQPDGDLRDNENIPLDPSITTTELIETYFQREVTPHVPDAWINASKRDEKDGEIGIVGYEIPFNRHFYVYQPPRSLEAIDADLDAVSKRIMGLLAEVHS